MWQALLPQARNTLFSHAQGTNNDTHYISHKTNSWFNYTFQKAKLDSCHVTLFRAAQTIMTAWGVADNYVAQLATRQLLINQQVANKFKIGLF